MVYRKLVTTLLNRISDPELEQDLVEYVTRHERKRVEEGEKSEEYLREEEERVRRDIADVKSSIVDRFDNRGRKYNKLAGFFVAVMAINYCFQLNYLQVIGLVISVVGSIILAIGVVHGIYWTYGLFIMAGFGNPSKYYREAILNDTVDGVYGVFFIISGFVIQFVAAVAC